MPKIKMLKTCLGHDQELDGRVQPLKCYSAGEEHDVCERLAKDFCEGLKVAERCEGKKAMKAAPENKAAK